MWVVFVLGMASCGSSPLAQIETQPNVLLVVVDTLRADAVQKNRDGVAVMPRLATFAEKSLYCPASVSPASWTRPAIASIMTSLDVDVHGVYFSVRRVGETRSTDVLPKSLDTIATLLQRRGYQTLGFQTNSHLTEETGFTRGFSSYRFTLNAPANEITDAALEALSTAKPPFFAYVHYIDPHAPYDAPDKFRDLFGERPKLSEEDERAAQDSLNYLKDRVYVAFGLQDKRDFAAISDAGKNELKVLYDADCRFLDTELARLLDDVAQRYPNTLIVVMSDHGEEFWEHGSMGHGTSVHVEQVEVPLIVHGPGVPAGARMDNVSTLDVLPTICGALGFDANPSWQGSNLLVPGRDTKSEFVYSRTRGPDSKFGFDYELVQRKPWKLIRETVSGKVSLYDKSNDPGEQHDVAEANPDVVRELTGALDARDAADRQHPLRQSPTAVPLTKETEESLGAIGYGAAKGPSKEQPPESQK